MDKITYLAQLAEGLARWVPERERQDILRYYAEYFEEAGPEREAEVVAELGDPWALSSRLAVEGGYVTQEGARNWTPRQGRRKVWPWVLAGAAVLAILFIGSGAIVFAQISRAVWRSNVAGYGEATPDIVISEEWTEAMPGADVGITFIEGEEYDGWFVSVDNGSLEVFESIDVDVGLGNITVSEGSDYTLFIRGSTALGSYKPSWEVKGGTLKIWDGSGRDFDLNGLKSLFGGDDFTLDVDITVPDGTLLDKVSVKTGLGNVMVYGTAVQKVDLETGMGNVECYEVRQAQKIDLDTGMGNVALYLEELYSGVDIDLESGMGNVEANLGCKESVCGYELESGMGTVTVNGANRGSKAERKGSAPYKLDAESGMGDVHVCFYED